MRVATLLGLGVLALVAALAADARRALTQPLSLSQPVVFEIAPGSGFKRIRGQLLDAGLLGKKSATYLGVWARIAGAESRIKSGEYRLTAGLTSLGLLELLTRGTTVMHELTLIEGWRFDQAMRAIRAHPALKKTLDGKSGLEIMQALDRGDQHPEGRFLPETYRFTRGTTDLDFLQRAYRDMQDALEQGWAIRAPGLPYRDADQALVMASIVERETGSASERPEIAGVFVRRLRLGMRLQTDPTVIYGLGAAFDGNLRKRDLLRDTPYNTYTRAGLPPTPICLPGRAAIHAALHPDSGRSLYFVARADGSGRHQFSDTLEQHNAAVRKFQLKRKNP